MAAVGCLDDLFLTQSVAGRAGGHGAVPVGAR